MSARIVLTFHGLGTPPPHVDAEERPYWLSWEAFDALLDRIDAGGSSARYAVTFDDGNATDVAAAQRLQQRGMNARFFVLASRIGQPGYLGGDELRALGAMGMIVGLHGYDHVDWRSLDRAGLARETIDARRVIEEALGEPVEEVAVPLGAYNARVMRWLKAQDFARIHTSDRGAVRDPAQRIWHRNSLRADMGERALAALLGGRWSWRERLGWALSRRLKGSA